MKFLSLLLFVSFEVCAAGGVSGGGGNLISPIKPTQYQYPAEIKNIIINSTHTLELFLEEQYLIYSTVGMNPKYQYLYGHLFTNKESSIHELIQSVTINVPLDKPCYDNLGNVFDGSFNPKNNSICISAYSIAIKSTKTDALTQAPALIFHELSELSGLSDENAVVLQMQALSRIYAR